MDYFKKDLGDIPGINLYNIADLHYGNFLFNRELAEAYIQRIQDDPVGYGVVNGDVLESITKESKGTPKSQIMSVEEQCEGVCDLLSPIKEKIIAWGGGNHDRDRAERFGQIAPAAYCAVKLGVPYFPESMVLKLRFGRKKHAFGQMLAYFIYFHHGFGAGKSEASKLNMLMSLGHNVHADLYVVGHGHVPLVSRDRYILPDGYNNRLRRVERVYVMTPSMLDYGGYAELIGCKPASNTYPVMHLSGKEKHIEVSA